MSRIKIGKQLELSSTGRSIIVTDGGGNPIYEVHSDAIVTDMDITAFDAIISAIVPGSDYVVMYSSGDGKTVKVPAASFLGSAGGARWRSLSVPAELDAAQAKSTAASIVITKPASDTFLVTVPTGVDMDEIILWIPAVENPGSTAKFRFDFQGTQADGSARLGTTDTDIILPNVLVGSYELPASAGSISSTNYIKYEKNTGTGVPEYRVTGRSPLEVTVVNYNQNNSAGNAESFVKFIF